MKTITQFLKFSSFICLLFVSALVVSCEDDSDENTNNNGGLSGVWTRLPGPSGDRTDLAIGGIEGESSDRVYMCEKHGSTAAGLYKGYIDGNIITWDSEYGLPYTYVEVVNGDLEFSYPDCDVCLVTGYERGSWGGDCGDLSNNGGGGSGDGQVMFWVRSDLGCGFITVNIAGLSDTIDGYYSAGSPSCGATSAATFQLPAGSYNYSASCDGLTWNGTVNVSEDGCFKMELVN
ncbi:MAG: hypothetical protein DI539_08965 [Flavobacterium psychrophilum]|nr:MAG: hypothetical protein DI539_08965 [Flavobacterium psychrophilum]